MATKIYSIAFMIMAVYTAASEQCCPDSWVQHSDVSGSCYRYFGQLTSYADALKACENAGGLLVSIADATEQNAVFTLWKSFTKDNYRKGNGYWIGLSRASHDDPFATWADGTSLDNTYWQEDEPSEEEDRNCVRVAYKGATEEEQQQWIARKCTQTKPYMCEMAAPEAEPEAEVPAVDLESDEEVPAVDLGSGEEVPAADLGSGEEVPAADLGSGEEVPAADLESGEVEVPAADLESGEDAEAEL